MITYQEVFSRGLTLRGMMHRPEGAGSQRLPAVLLCHGFTGTRVEGHQLFVKAARSLTAAGMVAGRFDFGGSGESDGEFVDMTPETEVQDAINLVHWLGAQPGVDRSRIGVIGLSLGGLVTACMASRTNLPKAIALWSATAHMGHRMQERATDESNAQLQEKGYIDRRGNRVGKAFIESALAIQPLQEAQQFEGDVFIVHGTEDQAVPVSEADEYARAFEHRQPKVLLMDGADHTFSREDWESRVINETVAWLGETLAVNG